MKEIFGTFVLAFGFGFAGAGIQKDKVWFFILGLIVFVAGLHWFVEGKIESAKED